MSGESSKTSPTIILTGTPGTGKTTHAQLLAEESPIPLKHINVGDLVKEKGLYEEYDEEWQSYTVDEDRVRGQLFFFTFYTLLTARPQLLDELEPLASAGGVILDWHTCELFPERWADLVVVLRCDHTRLWERLEKRCVPALAAKVRSAHARPRRRGYPLKKIQENNEAEIMEVVLDEARSSYPEQVVVELKSEGTEDLESNVARIVQWINAWRKDRGLDDAGS